MLPDCRLMVTVPTASVNKWQLDKKPQSSESDERAKRKGRARSLGPYEKIENKNGSKKQAWN